MLGVMLLVYPVAKGTDVVPAAASTKPEITDGSQWSLNLKPALSTHVIDQPFRHDSTRFKMLSLIVHIANIIVGILILFNYVFLC